MQSDVGIRKYVPSDRERLEDIRAAAFAPIFAAFRGMVGCAVGAHVFDDADAKQRHYLAELCSEPRSDALYVATLDHAVVGFIHLESDEHRIEGAIGLNAVHPDVRNRGLGTALYRFACDRFRREGFKVVKVSTGADPTHASARRAYAKAGFDRSIPTVSLYRPL